MADGSLPMRILVIRPGALGDALLTLPAVQALKRAFPQATIVAMGRLAVWEWLPGRSAVDAVVSFDRPDLGALFVTGGQLGAELRAFLSGFDLILSYVAAHKQVFANNLARAVCGQVVHGDARPPSELATHMSQHLQQPLRELGVPASDEPPRITPTPADRASAASWWEEHGQGEGPVLAMHPGSGSPAKNWPAEHFAAVARHLGWVRLLLLSGPADEPAVAAVQDALGDLPHTLASDLPMPLLAAMLERCDAYVGNDSGVSHLAAAVGVPSLAVFGPTDPLAWAPRGLCVKVLAGQAGCAPCDRDQRRACRRPKCLEAVSVREVVTELLQWLGPGRAGAETRTSPCTVA